MAKSDYAKFIKGTIEEVWAKELPKISPELTSPALHLKSDKDYGEHNFNLGWCPVTQPFVMVKDLHKHDFDQFLMFVGGNLNNMFHLGGEVELTLSLDGVNTETFTFTQATFVWVPKGLYHCPLIFKSIDDPLKPILFHDLIFANVYLRNIEQPQK
jgi:hypothetical protein